MREKKTSAEEPEEERCANCGYCKHCGQSKLDSRPVYPYQPTPTFRYVAPNYSGTATLGSTTVRYLNATG